MAMVFEPDSPIAGVDDSAEEESEQESAESSKHGAAVAQRDPASAEVQLPAQESVQAPPPNQDAHNGVCLESDPSSVRTNKRTADEDEGLPRDLGFDLSINPPPSKRPRPSGEEGVAITCTDGSTITLQKNSIMKRGTAKV